MDPFLSNMTRHIDSRRSRCSRCGVSGVWVNTTAGEIVQHSEVVALVIGHDQHLMTSEHGDLTCDNCEYGRRAVKGAESDSAEDRSVAILGAPHCPCDTARPRDGTGKHHPEGRE